MDCGRLQGLKKFGFQLPHCLTQCMNLPPWLKKIELLGEIYYGGCFEKILSLLDPERKFISKYNDPNEEACGMGTPCRFPPKRTESTKTIYHSGKKQKMFGY